MNDRILIGSRKGLFSYHRKSSTSWTVDSTHFLGDPVTIALHDARTGYHYAAIKHGHFGVKLHRAAEPARADAQMRAMPLRRSALVMTSLPSRWASVAAATLESSAAEDSAWS